MFTLFYTFLLIYTCLLFLHAEKSDKRWNFNVLAYTFTLYRVVYSVHFLFKSPKPNNSKGYGVRYTCFAPTSTPDPAKSDATRYGSWVIFRQPKSRPERSVGLLGRQLLAFHTPMLP